MATNWKIKPVAIGRNWVRTDDRMITEGFLDGIEADHVFAPEATDQRAHRGGKQAHAPLLAQGEHAEPGGR